MYQPMSKFVKAKRKDREQDGQECEHVDDERGDAEPDDSLYHCLKE